MPPIQIGPFIFPELRSGAREDIEAAIESATPRIVVEADGNPRKVCGCSGGMEVRP